ncbi:hypothetical protein HMPREF1624_06894 [Sporothrix schenckii ATCC 58251]|uniref:Pal1 cell morphology protein n=2 Tax=Sporothrix schenckii TaxID=29908 RepID=U7PQB7_SPOS1|nr:hypothetical protein HMPREF1624_06894 [Sporothrix schenckii ATCC 58251]
MSHQSPEMSKPKPTEERERERRSSSSRKHRSRHSRPYADTIDSLDRVGGVVYHHEGPYDATLAAVNRNKKKSPLEAVKDSNNEALKATPREYIQDSLSKHVPLQGTSNIPSGMPDRNGNVLHYEEGADLMREPDAPGGAYRRYDFLQYHPDDLKGKGEPSYSIEKAMKENNGKLRKHSSSLSHGAPPSMVFEMESRSGRRRGDGAQEPLLSSKGRATESTRRRSFSHASEAGPSAWRSGADLDSADPNRLAVSNDGSGLSRSGSNRLTDGIKRRFGSLRRK